MEAFAATFFGWYRKKTSTERAFCIQFIVTLNKLIHQVREANLCGIVGKDL
jgi:hypothetical protein